MQIIPFSKKHLFSAKVSIGGVLKPILGTHLLWHFKHSAQATHGGAKNLEYHIFLDKQAIWNNLATVC